MGRCQNSLRQQHINHSFPKDLNTTRTSISHFPNILATSKENRNYSLVYFFVDLQHPNNIKRKDFEYGYLHQDIFIKTSLRRMQRKCMNCGSNAIMQSMGEKIDLKENQSNLTCCITGGVLFRVDLT